MKPINIIIPVTTLIIGGGCGFAIGAAVTRKKWQKIADEEIKAVKDIYYNKVAAVEETGTTPAPEKKKAGRPKKQSNPSGVKMKEEVVDVYKDYSKMYQPQGETKSTPELVRQPEVKQEDVIYYISDVDYASSVCPAKELTFYADAVLTDDCNNMLLPDEEREMVGNLVNNAAFAAADVIYIHNELQELDYEVTYDNRKFSELKNSHPTED